MRSALAEMPAIPGWIALVTAAYLIIGVGAFAIYRVTGDEAWITSFFRMPGAVLMVTLALASVWFAMRVMRGFSSAEPMHTVWMCISGAAVFDAAGALFTQILSTENPLNPLLNTSVWSDRTAGLLHDYGFLLGGTFRFALLACGLAFALNIFRRTGLRIKLRLVDWLIWMAMGVYVVREVIDVCVAILQGKEFRFAQMAGWPVDFLLWFLLAEALQLYRSANQMQEGWIGRCWKALAWGVFLICIGVVAIWACNWSYLRWPWSALSWYVWLPAGAAFAMAPAYQLEAMRRAAATR